MIEFTRARRSKRRWNSLLPMINVLFILLVFVAITARPDAIKAGAVTPPTAQTGQSLPSVINTLTLTAKGDLLLNDAPLSLPQLHSTLGALFKTAPETALVLQVDAALDGRRMLEMLQLIQKAGGQKISILVQQPPLAKGS